MMSLPDFRYKQIVVHIACGRGERLKFRKDNIVIEDRDGNVLVQHSCHRLFALFIIGEISLTSVLVRQCVSFGFPIVLLGHNMRPIANIRCGAEGNTLLRKKQYCIAPEKQLMIAKELVRQKIANQMQLIRDLRYLSEADKSALTMMESFDVEVAGSTKELMGVEGSASRVFFAAYFRQLGWTRREPRCRPDFCNFLLDIGYTYLFQFVAAMLSLYGFDLYCGVLHSFFYQRMSLVCDIVEPFRCIVDRRVRKAHNLGQIKESDFFMYNGRLNLEWEKQAKYVQLFFKDILSEKESIFLFCQRYYRWFAREMPITGFPVFKIGEGCVSGGL